MRLEATWGLSCQVGGGGRGGGASDLVTSANWLHLVVQTWLCATVAAMLETTWIWVPKQTNCGNHYYFASSDPHQWNEGMRGNDLVGIGGGGVTRDWKELENWAVRLGWEGRGHVRVEGTWGLGCLVWGGSHNETITSWLDQSLCPPILFVIYTPWRFLLCVFALFITAIEVQQKNCAKRSTAQQVTMQPNTTDKAKRNTIGVLPPNWGLAAKSMGHCRQISIQQLGSRTQGRPTARSSQKSEPISPREIIIEDSQEFHQRSRAEFHHRDLSEFLHHY